MITAAEARHISMGFNHVEDRIRRAAADGRGNITYTAYNLMTVEVRKDLRAHLFSLGFIVEEQTYERVSYLLISWSAT